MKGNVVKYEDLCSSDHIDLTYQVNCMIACGWTPQGCVSTTPDGDLLLQVVVKYEEAEE